MKLYIIIIIIFISFTGSTTTYRLSESSSTEKKESINIPATSAISDLNPKQTNEFEFEIGLRDELGLMLANIYDKKSSAKVFTLESGLFPINFHLTTGLNYSGNYKIYLIYGFTYILEDFQGFDRGIFFRANLYNNFYGVLGLDFFNKMGSSHGLSNSPAKNYTFYCLGAGYNFSKHFNIDLMYYMPDEKVFGYDTNPESYTFYNKIDHGIIKLGFEYIITF